MPRLEGELAFFYSEFQLLGMDRTWSEGIPAPISSRNYLDYFELNNIPRSQWDTYVDALRRIDNKWLELKAKIREAEHKRMSSKAGHS